MCLLLRNRKTGEQWGCCLPGDRAAVSLRPCHLHAPTTFPSTPCQVASLSTEPSLAPSAGLVGATDKNTK